MARPLLLEETLRLTMILVLGAMLGIALGIGLPAAMGTPDDYIARDVPPVLHLERWRNSDKSGGGLRLEPAKLTDHL
ncbi:MAG TPA: hypothetical protein VJR47_20365 [Stellaceae bacterium]|nr:hypothetical protein [Stellaceae bacterium]